MPSGSSFGLGCAAPGALGILVRLQRFTLGYLSRPGALGECQRAMVRVGSSELQALDKAKKNNLSIKS